MKALTVQQPWAWAIMHGGKDVENRTQAWSYRGPLAIHAGQRWSERGAASRPIIDAAWEKPQVTAASNVMSLGRGDRRWHFGAIIGLVDLVDVHLEHDGCCESPWAETSYVEHGGRVRRSITHLVLEDPRPLAPIPCIGRLGLWTPPADVLEQLQEVADA